MQWFHLRPTFELQLRESREAAIAKLAAEQRRTGDDPLFLMFGEYGELHLPQREHRLWSPHLSFYVHQHAQHVALHGRFAPRVDVWTTVWIVYLAMIFTAFFGITVAASQWMIQESSWGGWIALAALVVLALLYIVAHVGQQWSADQMHQLRAKLDGILRAAEIEIDTNCAPVEIGSNASSSNRFAKR